MSPGAEVIQWDAVPRALNQLWYQAAPLINVHSNLAMHVRGGWSDEGTEILQWPFEGGWNQLYAIERVFDDYYKIVTMVDTTKVVTAAVGGQGGPVYLRTWAKLDTQLFQLLAAGNGACRLRNKQTGRYLQARGQSVTAGESVVDAEELINDSQLWTLNVH